MLIIGIDPGATGAIALISESDDVLLDVHDMPIFKVTIGATSNSQIAIAKLTEILEGYRARGSVHVYCEQVGATPGKGAVQMFRFGENFGVLKGLFAGLGLPVTFVHPSEWKRVTRTPKDKDGARLRASQVFPVWAPAFMRPSDDGRAEAALIGFFGARHRRNSGR